MSGIWIFQKSDIAFLLTYQKTLIENEMKSNILLVEVDGDACVDPHNKKGEERQDEQFWRRKVAFRFAAYSHNKKAFSLRQ